MKRMLLIAVTSSAALVLGAPGVASAHHGSHHHARHHAHRARVLFFGTAPAGSSSGSVGSSQSTPIPPSGSSEPQSSTEENAGKVKSFEGGVLTIVLSDGTTVSGKVTERTELECQSAMAAPTVSREDDHEDSNAEGSHEDGGDGSSTETSREDGGGSGEESGDDDARGEAPSCTTAALTPETVVREAELMVSSSGAEWEKVDLLLK